jgi:hypothetical protein
MTVTHGTRSAYNKGCRCEACREASRRARDRQRAAVEDRAAPTEPGATTGWPRVYVVGLAAIGVGSLLHARRLKAEHGHRSRYGRGALRVFSLSDSPRPCSCRDRLHSTGLMSSSPMTLHTSSGRDRWLDVFLA